MKISILGLAALSMVPNAYASPPSDVSVQLDVFKVTIAATGGAESFKPAGTVLPGDIIEYRALYRNQGTSVARNVEASLPIPPINVVYVADSARPRNAMASTDGTKFDELPLKRVVTKPDGLRQTQLVPLSEYRSLRWKLGDLSAGSSVTVISRVRVTSLDTVEANKTSVIGAHAGAGSNVAH